MQDTDDDETTIVTPQIVTRPITTQVVSQPYQQLQLDPISTILLLPFLPLIQFINMQIQMMNQQAQNSSNNQSKTKVTSITRNGNTLDIIEKWI